MMRSTAVKALLCLAIVLHVQGEVAELQSPCTYLRESATRVQCIARCHEFVPSHKIG